MNQLKSLTAAGFALLLLAACSSAGMGDIFGGGNDSSYAREIRGTVDYVDTSSRSVVLTNVSGTNMLSGGSSGSSVRVYYDDRTSVEYQGRSYRPSDLERGDQVAVRVDQSGNNLIAESMVVTYNSASGIGNSGGSYNSTVTGTVRSINTSSRSIEIDRGYGSTTWVEYDTSTPVYFNNQTYRPADLERGDQVEIRVRDLGSGRLLAQDMTVIRSVSGSTGGSSSSYATLRGTVRSIDTVRRTIQLESTSWISGFTSGNSGSIMTVQYGSNTSVDVQGRLHPVANLERGDVIEVQVTNASSTLPTAQAIYLIRDVNSRY